MRDHLTEGWPLGSTSTVYMNGNSVYHVRRYGKPGIIATVELRQEQAEAIREVVEERIRDARAAELEAAAEEADAIASVSSYSGSEDDMESLLNTATRLRARAAAIRAGGK